MVDKTIVFIVGSGRSGSTILDLSLGANPECFSVGEINTIQIELMENRWCTCGDAFSDCSFWNNVISVIEKANLSQNVNLLLKIPTRENKYSLHTMKKILALSGCEQVWPEVISDNKSLFDAIFKVSGKRIIIDSCKDPWRAIILSKYLGYNCKFVHLIRDLRGVSHSRKKPTYSVALPPDFTMKTYPEENAILTVKETTKEWKKINLQNLFLLHFFINSRNRITVRYEDLISNPKSALTRLTNWLGIIYNDDMIHFGNIVHHNVGGNPSRFNSSSIQNIPEKWRLNLSKEEKNYCERNAKFLLKYFGYS